MATFKLEINLDNDAFGSTPDEQADEIARILADVARQLRENGTMTPRDINGNRVGKAEVTR